MPTIRRIVGYEEVLAATAMGRRCRVGGARAKGSLPLERRGRHAPRVPFAGEEAVVVFVREAVAEWVALAQRPLIRE